MVRSPYAEELRAEARAEMLVDLLIDRFGPLSEHDLQRLSAVQQRERLLELTKAAFRSETLDDFLKNLDK